MNAKNQPSQYISNQVQRTLRVMRVMAGHEVQGISPKEMATLANVSNTDITRIIANLEAQQFVECLPSNTKRFRLAATLVQIANTVSLNLTQAVQQLDNDRHNYTRLA